MQKNMTETLESLKKLQDVLAEKYDLEVKIEDLPKSLDGSKEGLERFKKEYLQLNDTYEAEKEKRDSVKEELDQTVKNREEGEKGMDAAQTHREYEVLEKQISEAAAKEDELRKELQAEEHKLSEMSSSLKDLEDLIASTESEVNSSEQNLNKQLDDCSSSIASLTKKEEKMSDGIDSETLIKFQRIIRRNRKGIVAVKGKVCDGCHMILPAQFANEVRQGDKIMFCPYCSRILFYEESAVSYSSFLPEDYDGSDDLYDEDLLKDEDDYDAENADEEKASSDDYANE